MSEQEKKPSVANYWSKPPIEQGKIREQVQPPTQPSRCITVYQPEQKRETAK